MVLTGNVAIYAPRKKVWGFLTVPNQIGQCLTGVEQNAIIEPNKSCHAIAVARFSRARRKKAESTTGCA